MAGIHQTQVNLDGLLEILGKNLYSTPSVALRELVQNAHDACERYRIEAGKEDGYEIFLKADEQNNTLTIQDNGSGLTESEILEYLATVGSGYTRVLRNASQSESMIGYFGLGFLSAYVVSDKVEVYTTSYKTPEQTWLFSSAGGKSFTVSECATREVGTTVVLYLDYDFTSLSVETVLFALIEKYCCLLDVPIYINNSTQAANNLEPTWAIDENTSALQIKKKALSFAQVFEDDFEPICCIPIPKDNPFHLKGLLWVQDGSSYASTDNRNASLFVRNMFITNEQRELLPRWAGFIGGVFESIYFNPTASRESIQKDEYFYQVSEYIKEQLILGLRNIVLNEPEAWRRILTRHSQALLGASLNDPRLFDVCHKQLKVPTSMGDMSLSQVVSMSGGEIYIKPTADSGCEETLFRARHIPVVSGFLYAAMDFCRQYGEINNVAVRILGSQKDEDKLFPKKELPPQLTDLYRQLLCRKNEDLIISNFEPEFIPLLAIEDSDVKLKKKIEDDETDKRIGAAALSLARIHTNKITKQHDRRVYLNLKNPLVQKLEESSVEKRKILADLIRSFMDAVGTSSENAEGDFSNTLKTFNESILLLVE